MRRVLLFAIVLLLMAFAVGLAETRQVLDIKTGAGAGVIGLGLDVEALDQGYSFWAAAGVGRDTGIFGVGLRWYFAVFTPEGLPSLRSRLFAGPLVTTSGKHADSFLDQLRLGATVGYAWRASDNVRMTVEAGYAFIFTDPDPAPILGLAVGWRL